MPQFDIYEPRRFGQKWIGSVEAESLEDARDTAHEQYGAPIIVTEAIQ